MGVGSLAVAVAPRKDRRMEGEKKRQALPSHPEQGLQGLCKGLGGARYSVAAVGVFSKTHCLESLALLSVHPSLWRLGIVEAQSPCRCAAGSPSAPPTAGLGGWQFASNEGVPPVSPRKMELKDRATSRSLL